MGSSEKWLGTLGGLLGLGLFALLVGVGPLAGEDAAVRPRATPRSTAHPTVDVAPAPPLELRIPSLKISATVVPVGLGADRTLRPPRKPKLVGWWKGSAKPGAERGGTVVAGHTVHTGGGALDRLTRAKPGATLELRTRTARWRYRLDSIRTYRKAGLA
ncbi:MAG TPA: class F sortase, partial [Actinopolymorphaceae bacterium]